MSFHFNVMTKWNSLQRKLSWQMISMTSRHLNSDIMTFGGTAFTLMHHHYANEPDGHHKIYVLILATLFISGKLEDDFHSLNDVLKSFKASIDLIVETFKKLDVKSILEIDQNETFDLTQALTEEICKIEIPLLSSLNWTLNVDSPFKHIDKKMIDIKEPDKHRLYEALILVIASIMQSKNYIQIPFDIIVAAALTIAYSVTDYPVPATVNHWIEKQKANNLEVFEYSLSYGCKFIDCCMNDVEEFDFSSKI